MTELTAIALGLGLGFVTGMPLGVINVAIVDAATVGHRRLALGLAVGGALADTVHASAAFFGIAQLVTARPDLIRVLAIVATTTIIAYAVVTWRARRPTMARADASDRGIARGIVIGLGLTLPNPGALGAWVSVAAIWPAGTPVVAGLVAAGVGIGSTVWFVLLGRWVGKVERNHPLVRAIPRLAVVALITLAIVGLVRVV